MISSIKSSTIVRIDIGKEKTFYRERLINDISTQNNIDKSALERQISFSSYQKRSQEFYAPLISFIDKLVTQQSELQKRSAEKINKEELDPMIFENEASGIEKTAEKIVDFAQRLIGNDTSKADQLKRAVKKGFNQVEKNLGELSDIAQETCENVIKKIASWSEDRK